MEFKQEYPVVFPDYAKIGQTWKYKRGPLTEGVCKILSIKKEERSGVKYLCEFINIFGEKTVGWLFYDELVCRKLSPKEKLEEELAQTKKLLQFQRKSTEEWAAEAHKWYNKHRELKNEKI